MLYVFKNILPNDLIAKRGPLCEYYIDLIHLDRNRRNIKKCYDEMIYNYIHVVNNEMDYLYETIQQTKINYDMVLDNVDDTGSSVLDMTTVINAMDDINVSLQDWFHCKKGSLTFIADQCARYKHMGTNVPLHTASKLTNYSVSFNAFDMELYTNLQDILSSVNMNMPNSCIELEVLSDDDTSDSDFSVDLLW
jgi:hypothetical protein